MAGNTKGRKGRVGKKKGWIAAYYSSGRYYFNKARRIAKHIKRYGEKDPPANEALKVCIAAMPRHMSKQFD